MRFDDLSREEKIEYKKQTMKDFIEHGMNEKEALVNYVFCVNPDPLGWLEYRYCMDRKEAEDLRRSGMETYRNNGGKAGCKDITPSEGRRTRSRCKCMKVQIPE